MESPTTDEVKFLMEKYDVHPLVAEELLRPTLRPKVDNYQNSAYLILHFPTLGSDFKKCDSCEVDFIIGKNFLITVHYQAINSLIELGKIFEADALLGENNLSKNAGILFFHIVRNLYELSMKQIDNLQMQIEEIEQKMFEKKGSQYNLVRKISHVRRDILDFARTMQPHKEVFSSFEFMAAKFFGPEFLHYVSNLTGEYYKVWNAMESNKSTIASLQATNDSLLSNRTNDIMTVLTIMAFVTFPLMLITSIFGMNTIYLPIVGSKYDFWIIIGIMAMSTIIMFTFFKRKKWL